MTDASAPERHLVLVGLMGVGKTAVGTECARRLGRVFVDTDDLVVATAGMPVDEIFARGGEALFRQFEKRVVDDACAAPTPAVIACGGGTVLDPDNRRRLRSPGFVVWLRAPVDVLAARVDTGPARPLLAGRPVAATLERLAQVREPAYEAAAHVRIDCDDRPVEQVVDDVLSAFAGASP